jgi:Zn-dependent protease with chaperone function
MRRFAYLLFLIAISSQTKSAWLVSDLIKSKNDSVLLSREGQIERIRTQQLREISFIFQKLCARAGQPATLWIETGPTPNASAQGLGNNRITVSFGMIELLGDKHEEWAALIGHELAHLKLDHAKAGMKRRIPLSIAEELINEKVKHKTTRDLLGLSTKAIGSHYSQKQEYDSDYLGTIWTVEAGFSPWGGVQLHQKLLRVIPRDNYPNFLKSHPSSQQRIKALSRLARDLD